MHQQRLLVRAQALARLKCLPDPLLALLLCQSDPVPERVPQAVILFRQGERVQDWYLLLSGEVQLFLDQTGQQQQQLMVIRPGIIFGELQSSQCHSCAARVLKSAEFVRIGQSYFLNLYNKWADQLQPCMQPMEDLTSTLGPSTSAVANGQRKVSRLLPRSPSERRRNHHHHHRRMKEEEEEEDKIGNGKHLNGFMGEPRKRAEEEWGDEMGRRRMENGQRKMNGEGGGGRGRRRNDGGRRAEGRGRGMHLLELTGTIPSIEDKLQTAMTQLGQAMSANSAQQITGSEFCAKFHVLWVQCFGRPPSTHLVAVGVGQALLDRAHLIPAARAEHQPQFLNSSSAHYQWQFPPYSSAAWEDENGEEEGGGGHVVSLMDSLLLLSNVGADCLLQSILRKSEEHRTEDELDVVYEEIGHIRAFNHLSRGMKRGLARVLCWEGPEHAGTVVFREGEPAGSWYVVLKGTLEAKANGGKRSMLREGDDFGKLALLNGGGGDGPNGGNGQQTRSRRQATVVTAQDGCQLLRVDSVYFQRILRDVEADTVRLKQQQREEGERQGRGGVPQKDVLVLQRDHPKGRHSLVAGLPEKILEYILETRMELGPGEELIEDALLTQPIWMPSNRLCDALKQYYACGSLGCSADWPPFGAHSPSAAFEHGLSAKRRTIQFILGWQALLGSRFFLDPIANAFVEELYSCLLEDAKMGGGGMALAKTALAQMQGLMMRREEAMQRLCLPPRLVLDCGAYSANAPAPNPVLPSDICNQAVLLPDSSQLTLRLRLDQSANEIAKLARLGRQEQPTTGDGHHLMAAPEECLLFELTADGQKLAIGGAECSVPTMLSPGSILLAALPSENAQIPLFPLPSKPPKSIHSPLVLLLGPDRLARAMALVHFKLLKATSEAELVVLLIGRDQFPARLAPSNLDLLLRRFAQLQLWVISEVLFASDLGQRVATLRGFIQLAQRAKASRDLLAMAAICLGLSSLPVSRLAGIWARLPCRIRRLHAQNQTLLWPGRSHRNYRLFAGALRTPMVPFVPLLLKEMDFVHEGRPSHLGDGLVSWEKMHLVGRLVRSFRHAKGGPSEDVLGQMIAELGRDKQTRVDEALVRNLHTIEGGQAELMRLSTNIQQQEGQG